MHRTWTIVRATGLGFLFSLALFGCNDNGSPLNPPQGALGGTGLLTTVPQIGGDWLATATVTSNTCAVLTSIPPDEIDLLIDQLDTVLSVDLLTPCGGNTGTSTGTITPSNVISLSSKRTEVVSQDCVVQRTDTVTATANNLGDEITGSVKVEFEPLKTAGNDCGKVYPCLYEQAFTAVPCPDSGCLLSACPVSAAP